MGSATNRATNRAIGWFWKDNKPSIETWIQLANVDQPWQLRQSPHTASQKLSARCVPPGTRRTGASNWSFTRETQSFSDVARLQEYQGASSPCKLGGADMYRSHIWSCQLRQGMFSLLNHSFEKSRSLGFRFWVEKGWKRTVRENLLEHASLMLSWYLRNVGLICPTALIDLVCVRTYADMHVPAPYAYARNDTNMPVHSYKLCANMHANMHVNMHVNMHCKCVCVFVCVFVHLPRRVLRHDAKRLGLQMRSDGSVALKAASAGMGGWRWLVTVEMGMVQGYIIMAMTCH